MVVVSACFPSPPSRWQPLGKLFLVTTQTTSTIRSATVCMCEISTLKSQVCYYTCVARIDFFLASIQLSAHLLVNQTRSTLQNAQEIVHLTKTHDSRLERRKHATRVVYRMLERSDKLYGTRSTVTVVSVALVGGAIDRFTR